MLQMQNTTIMMQHYAWLDKTEKQKAYKIIYKGKAHK